MLGILKVVGLFIFNTYGVYGLLFDKQFYRAQDGTLPPPQNYTAQEKDANQEVDHAPYGLCDMCAPSIFPRDGQIFVRRDAQHFRLSGRK